MRTMTLLLLASAFATTAAAVPLDIVTVGAPAINCKFDTDCQITVSDTTAAISLPATTGSGFLQSRTFPPGQPGTAAAGLYAYLYRIDLRNLVGITAAPCVSQLRLEFGPVSLVDYNSDGNTDQVFVVTAGGLGSVGPSSADQTGNQITFTFSPPVCSGSSPGRGDSSFFFGLASTQPDRHVTAQITYSPGAGTLSLDARVPQLAGAQPGPFGFQYAAKILCTSNIPGTSQTTGSVLPGSYQTVVNLHNPNSVGIRYRKKIATPAGISKFFTASLDPDAAARVDCKQITQGFGINFIHGAEGFLVIESTHSLDVIAVYTAGKGNVASIDVEDVQERKLR